MCITLILQNLPKWYHTVHMVLQLAFFINVFFSSQILIQIGSTNKRIQQEYMEIW